ncbi:MAG: histidine phosphatase family protein [Butyrivibrio sp.]|nr:histidine phosphatase family protein [Butyrivibrio sp.]
MEVTIIRHGKVKHTWKKICSSEEFDEECRLYDIAPIEEMASASVTDASKIYISTLDRSYQTAKNMYGEGAFIRTELINEVPLKSAFDIQLKLPTWFWNILGRLQWLVNSSRQPESKLHTIKRAERFTQDIVERNEDCVLVTHGFFMHTLISVMKRRGFNCDKTSAHYKNGEVIILTL